MDEIAVKPEPPLGQVKRGWFSGSVILEGLRSHLQTSDYARVLQDIDKFDEEDAANLIRCRQFVDSMKKEIEKNFQVSIPLTDSGEQGFTISFVQTVCADAVERARGTGHYDGFPYTHEGENLRFGALFIYKGFKSQDLKPIETIHREMREKCSRWVQAQQIARQVERISEILQAISRQLEIFALLECVPGKCDLCIPQKK